MESLDLYTLEAIAKDLCPYCTHSPLHEQKNFSKDDDINTRGLVTSLASLSLTSHSANAVATPHLYHQPTTRRWGLLLRTLLARPDLARRVRRLSTRAWVPTGINEPCLPLEARAYWIRQYPRHPSNGGVIRLPRNNLAPLVASLCPELQELDAAVDDGVMRGFRTLPREPPSLERLRAITVSWRTGEVGTTLPEVGHLVSLAPNLERFVALVEGDFRLMPEYLQDEYFLSLPLLLGSRPRSRRLVHFDRIARRVSGWHFPYSVCPKQWDTVGMLMPGLSGIRRDRRDVVPFYDLMDDPWCVRGLADRTEVETFSLDVRCLVPHANPRMRGGFPPSLSGEPRVSDEVLVDLLPPSVCELRIFRDSIGPELADLGPAMSSLAEAAPERFRHLVKVEVAGQGAEVLRPWRGRFESLDVEFLISSERRSVSHGYKGLRD